MKIRFFKVLRALLGIAFNTKARTIFSFRLKQYRSQIEASLTQIFFFNFLTFSNIYICRANLRKFYQIFCYSSKILLTWKKRGKLLVLIEKVCNLMLVSSAYQQVCVISYQEPFECLIKQNSHNSNLKPILRHP